MTQMRIASITGLALVLASSASAQTPSLNPLHTLPSCAQRSNDKQICISIQAACTCLPRNASFRNQGGLVLPPAPKSGGNNLPSSADKLFGKQALDAIRADRIRPTAGK